MAASQRHLNETELAIARRMRALLAGLKRLQTMRAGSFAAVFAELPAAKRTLIKELGISAEGAEHKYFGSDIEGVEETRAWQTIRFRSPPTLRFLRRHFDKLSRLLVEHKITSFALAVGDTQAAHLQFLDQAIDEVWKHVDARAVDGGNFIRSPFDHDFKHQFAHLRNEYDPESRRVPFGGRAEELTTLNAWLDDEKAAPRFLVAGDAGSGKTALLFEWIKRVTSRPVERRTLWHLAFVPIAVSAGTHVPNNFYQYLCHRLAQLSGIEALPDVFGGWMSAVHRQIAGLVAQQKRVLVIIDGIDELLDQFPATSLFPEVLHGVRVLLSARFQGDLDELGWLRRLGWPHDTPTTSLKPLRGEEGIKSVIQHLGPRFSYLAEDNDVVSELVRITEGHCILVRHYLDELTLRAQDDVRVTKADLATIQPGFGNYFETLAGKQQKLWDAQGRGVSWERFNPVLSVLAFALGPLESKDLLELVQVVHGVALLTERDSLLPLHRFVRGNGRPDSGYYFNHPLVGQHLQESWYVGRRAIINAGFVAWGRRQLATSTAVEQSTYPISNYALRHLPAHFEAGKASLSDWMLFTQDRWHQAYSKEPSGILEFAQSVEIVWKKLRTHPLTDTLAEQWRCAIVLSAIRSLTANMPCALVVEAVRHGILSTENARNVILAQGMPLDRIRALLKLALIDCEYAEHVADDLLTTDRIPRRVQASLLTLVKLRGEEFCAQAYRVVKLIDEWNMSVSALSEAANLYGDTITRAIAYALFEGELMERDPSRMKECTGPLHIQLRRLLRKAKGRPVAPISQSCADQGEVEDKESVFKDAVTTLLGKAPRFMLGRVFQRDFLFSFLEVLELLANRLDDAEVTEVVSICSKWDARSYIRAISILAPWLTASQVNVALSNLREAISPDLKDRAAASLERGYETARIELSPRDSRTIATVAGNGTYVPESIIKGATQDLLRYIALDQTRQDAFYTRMLQTFTHKVSRNDRWYVIVYLAPFIPPGHVPDWLKLARTIRERRERAITVAALGHCLEATARMELFLEAVEILLGRRPTYSVRLLIPYTTPSEAELLLSRLLQEARIGKIADTIDALAEIVHLSVGFGGGRVKAAIQDAIATVARWYGSVPSKSGA